MRRFYLISALGILLCVLAVWGGSELYQRWRAQSALSNARRFLEQSDLRNASLSLQSTRRRLEANAEARRLMAQICDAARSPEAILHRRAVADLLPGELQPKLDWANAALSFGQPRLALQALEAVPAGQRENLSYLEVLASYQVVAGDNAAADATFQKILQTAPRNAAARLNLAVIQLQSGDASLARAAAATLRELLQVPAVTLKAHRALIAHAQTQAVPSEALDLSRALIRLEGAVFGDHLLRLSVLKTGGPDGDETAASFLAALQEQSAARPADAFELGKWMLAHDSAAAARGWIESLPEKTRTSLPVPMVLADACLGLRDWPALENLVKSADWQMLEPYRLAFLSRAEREQGMDQHADVHWQGALLAGRRQTPILLALAQDAEHRGRIADAAQAYWLLAETPLALPAAREWLLKQYTKQRDARNLLRLMEIVVRERPEDQQAKRLLTMLLLVLEQERVRANRLAVELYQADRENFANTLLYAYSLHLQGKSPEAAALLAATQPSAKELADSSYQIFGGLIYAAAEQETVGRQLLTDVKPNDLFPEMVPKVQRALKSL